MVNGVIGSSRTTSAADPVAVIEGIMEDGTVEKTRHEVDWNVKTMIVQEEMIDQTDSIVLKR